MARVAFHEFCTLCSLRYSELRLASAKFKKMSRMLLAFRFSAAGLLFVTTSAYCAGGPNMIEGASIVDLWFRPAIGSLLIFVVLCVVSWKQALVTLFVTASILVILVSISPVAYLGVLLLGPWFVFASFLLVSLCKFSLWMYKGSKAVKGARSSRLPRNNLSAELNEMDAMAYVRDLEDLGFMVERATSGRWVVTHPERKVVHRFDSIDDLALYARRQSPGNG